MSFEHHITNYFKENKQGTFVLNCEKYSIESDNLVICADICNWDATT